MSNSHIVLPCDDLVKEMNFFTFIGFRLDNIFPSDDPAVAFMSGHGICIRIDKNEKIAPALLHILTDTPQKIGEGKYEYISPCGTIIKIVPKTYQLSVPKTQHKFEIRELRDKEPWVIGRAGMLYRDLIPDRLGGSIIASHIRIPNGGPVPDMVHYHTIGFQLIFCYQGWVKVVYEDQGEPIILHAGDCVTQPPEIRHRVLEASDNLEVIEIGVPAAHMTTIDHSMELPTKTFNPKREFKGQTFCHHQLKNAVWQNWELEDFKFRDTGINDATRGAASVVVIKADKKNNSSNLIKHNADIHFTFVMQGQIQLIVDGHGTHILKKGEAFVMPPNVNYQINNLADNLELLQVSLP